MRYCQNGRRSGDPGGNRTRDNLIKRPLLLDNFIFNFQWLPLILAPKSTVKNRQFPHVNSIIRHNLAIMRCLLTCAMSCYNVLYMNLMQIRQKLHDLCQDADGVRAWAESQKPPISFSYVAAVIRGDAKPGRKILKAMGMRKAFDAKKTTVMRFEDV